MKTKKILTCILLSLMLVLSGGVLFSSMYALESSPSHSTTSSVIFSDDSGIRFNSLTGQFEVFSAAGFSWISSARYISVIGDVAPEGDSQHSNDDNWAQALGNATYNIMNDITYNEIGNFNPAFLGDNPTLPSIAVGGVVNGHGCTLTDFPVRRHQTTDYHSSLFYEVKGKLDGINLTLSKANNIEVPSEDRNVGGICAYLDGEISNCTFRGIINGRRTGSTTKSCYVSGIVSSFLKGKISSCSSYGSLSGRYAAGIVIGFVEAWTERIMEHCENYADIYASDAAGGIMSYTYTGKFIGCINRGSITCNNRAGGMLGEGNYDGGYNFEQCINYGTIISMSASSYAGGMSGWQGDGSATNCANYGTIFGSSVGGISGALGGWGPFRITGFVQNGNIFGSENSSAAIGAIWGEEGSNSVICTGLINTGMIVGGNSGILIGAIPYGGVTYGTPSVKNVGVASQAYGNDAKLVGHEVIIEE